MSDILNFTEAMTADKSLFANKTPATTYELDAYNLTFLKKEKQDACNAALSVLEDPKKLTQQEDASETVREYFRLARAELEEREKLAETLGLKTKTAFVAIDAALAFFNPLEFIKNIKDNGVAAEKALKEEFIATIGRVIGLPQEVVDAINAVRDIGKTVDAWRNNPESFLAFLYSIGSDTRDVLNRALAERKLITHPLIPEDVLNNARQYLDKFQKTQVENAFIALKRISADRLLADEAEAAKIAADLACINDYRELLKKRIKENYDIKSFNELTVLDKRYDALPRNVRTHSLAPKILGMDLEFDAFCESARNPSQSDDNRRLLFKLRVLKSQNTKINKILIDELMTRLLSGKIFDETLRADMIAAVNQYVQSLSSIIQSKTIARYKAELSNIARIYDRTKNEAIRISDAPEALQNNVNLVNGVGETANKLAQVAQEVLSADTIKAYMNAGTTLSVTNEAREKLLSDEQKASVVIAKEKTKKIRHAFVQHAVIQQNRAVLAESLPSDHSALLDRVAFSTQCVAIRNDAADIVKRQEIAAKWFSEKKHLQPDFPLNAGSARFVDFTPWAISRLIEHMTMLATYTEHESLSADQKTQLQTDIALTRQEIAMTLFERLKFYKVGQPQDMVAHYHNLTVSDDAEKMKSSQGYQLTSANVREYVEFIRMYGDEKLKKELFEKIIATESELYLKIIPVVTEKFNAVKATLLPTHIAAEKSEWRTTMETQRETLLKERASLSLDAAQINNAQEKLKQAEKAVEDRKKSGFWNATPVKWFCRVIGYDPLNNPQKNANEANVALKTATEKRDSKITSLDSVDAALSLHVDQMLTHVISRIRDEVSADKTMTAARIAAVATFIRTTGNATHQTQLNDALDFTGQLVDQIVTEENITEIEKTARCVKVVKSDSAEAVDRVIALLKGDSRYDAASDSTAQLKADLLSILADQNKADVLSDDIKEKYIKSRIENILNGVTEADSSILKKLLDFCTADEKTKYLNQFLESGLYKKIETRLPLVTAFKDTQNYIAFRDKAFDISTWNEEIACLVERYADDAEIKHKYRVLGLKSLIVASETVTDKTAEEVAFRRFILTRTRDFETVRKVSWSSYEGDELDSLYDVKLSDKDALDRQSTQYVFDLVKAEKTAETPSWMHEIIVGRLGTKEQLQEIHTNWILRAISVIDRNNNIDVMLEKLFEQHQIHMKDQLKTFVGEANFAQIERKLQALLCVQNSDDVAPVKQLGPIKDINDITTLDPTKVEIVRTLGSVVVDRLFQIFNMPGQQEMDAYVASLLAEKDLTTLAKEYLHRAITQNYCSDQFAQNEIHMDDIKRMLLMTPAERDTLQKRLRLHYAKEKASRYAIKSDSAIPTDDVLAAMAEKLGIAPTSVDHAKYEYDYQVNPGHFYGHYLNPVLEIALVATRNHLGELFMGLPPVDLIELSRQLVSFDRQMIKPLTPFQNTAEGVIVVAPLIAPFKNNANLQGILLRIGTPDATSSDFDIYKEWLNSNQATPAIAQYVVCCKKAYHLRNVMKAARACMAIENELRLMQTGEKSSYSFETLHALIEHNKTELTGKQFIIFSQRIRALETSDGKNLLGAVIDRCMQEKHRDLEGVKKLSAITHLFGTDVQKRIVSGMQQETELLTALSAPAQDTAVISQLTTLANKKLTDALSSFDSSDFFGHDDDSPDARKARATNTALTVTAYTFLKTTGGVSAVSRYDSLLRDKIYPKFLEYVVYRKGDVSKSEPQTKFFRYELFVAICETAGLLNPAVLHLIRHRKDSANTENRHQFFHSHSDEGKQFVAYCQQEWMKLSLNQLLKAGCELNRTKIIETNNYMQDNYAGLAPNTPEYIQAERQYYDSSVHQKMEQLSPKLQQPYGAKERRQEVPARARTGRINNMTDDHRQAPKVR